MNKFILGSAQLGMNYGVSNKKGKVHFSEAKKIIDFAQKNDIHFIDTAMNYGSSEDLIGKLCNKSWDIITKIPKFPDNISNVSSWFESNTLRSLEKLNRKKINTLLIHEPNDLKNTTYGKDLISLIIDLKSEGVIKNIGLSIYDAFLIEEYLDLIDVDIIQAPFNIFDRRIIDSGWAKKLNESGIEVHARSIFLQGLLLMEDLDRPKYFQRWSHIWDSWRTFLNDNNISAIDVCVYYVNQCPHINKILIGVESQEQLKQIVESSNTKISDLNFDNFCINDEDLIDPSRWP